jgi:predicted pyridoxine 5'-phosphate oxidase superfamily flavin-nucleotide-binding protein
MAAIYSELDERLIKFITSQPMFFVATAPCLDRSGSGGHVNVSPKGYRDTFAVIDPLTVAYLDLTGSGAETIAHLRQNGRITIMFCSFDRTPKIVRIHGTGRVILPGEPDWADLAPYFPAATDERKDCRSIIVVAADRISDSCGYSVPLMDLVDERDLLIQWADRKSADDLAAYRVKHNSASIDGLPAIGETRRPRSRPAPRHSPYATDTEQ